MSLGRSPLRAIRLLACTALPIGLAACSSGPPPLPVAPIAAEAPSPAAIEDARVAELLAGMSLERKIAQLIMPDISTVTPDDMRQYRFGTILNGGNSGPGGNDLAPAPQWLALADAFWDAANAPLPEGGAAIPHLWATDAVHGHNNIIGATLFPHNIGLGATRDADLVRRIGRATALEISATGIDWTFAPTLAVVQDPRWGRTYESFSEDPKIVAALGAAMVEGLQGGESGRNILGDGHVLATAKHFFGDGGTKGGIDQGDTAGALPGLIALHGLPYRSTIASGAQTVMASFSSINGTKMHGSRPLLNDLLRGEMGFDGLVVGDWNGHAQIPGCSNSDCPQALLAGLDVYMVPEDWKALYASLLAQARSGEIPPARIDEAVGRVLRVKLRSGVFEAGRPSGRPYAGRWALFDSPDHRALAREAVAKSMVILKNDGVLPLRAGANILVAGSAADNVAQQAGGWTLTWQGGGALEDRQFPGAESIFNGLAESARRAGGSATLSTDGRYEGRPDVAIVVFGEQPYAEFTGDRSDLILRDEEGLRLLRKFRAAGIPAVAVLLSGRPLWMNREINAADAFVAAWLPGSEGGGVADVLTGARPASGRLSFSWSGDCSGSVPLAAPLFRRGYGLATGERSAARLDERCALLDSGPSANPMIFGSGRLGEGVSAVVGGKALPGLRGSAGSFTASGLDNRAQEDARLLKFTDRQQLTLRLPAPPKPPAGGTVAYRIVYALDSAPGGRVAAGVDCSGAGCRSQVDLTAALGIAAGKGWRELQLTAECLPGLDSARSIALLAEKSEVKLAEVQRVRVPSGTGCRL